MARPCTKWLGLDEIAEVLGVEPAWLLRVLGRFPQSLPGARLHGDEVMIKEADLWKALGLNKALPVTCSVAEAAACLGKSEKTLYAWLARRGPDGEALITHWRWCGVVRLSVASVLALPERLPSWAGASDRAFSFFANGESGEAEPLKAEAEEVLA